MAKWILSPPPYTAYKDIKAQCSFCRGQTTSDQSHIPNISPFCPWCGDNMDEWRETLKEAVDAVVTIRKKEFEAFLLRTKGDRV